MKTKRVIGYVLLYISNIILFSTFWIKINFNLIDFESFLFTILMPIAGTSKELILSGVFWCALAPILLTTVIIITIKKLTENDQKAHNTVSIIRDKTLLISLVLFISVVAIFCVNLKVGSYIKSKLQKTDIYEKYYVDPKNVAYVFPEKKRNLILIYLESVETSFYDKQSGGALEENVIPELYDLAVNNITFTDKNNQGYVVAPGASWTIASNVASLCGIPFGSMFQQNRKLEVEDCFPGAYGLGDILHDNGYNNVFMVGDDASFASTDSFFKKHGNYQIEDLFYAYKQGWIGDGYYKNWGYEDGGLFMFAKEELKSLASQGKPFNLIMSTLDTHSPDGYVCESCPNEYDKQMFNVLRCSSKQATNFVEWVKQQDFYKDTTIVIMGDHISMSTTLSDIIDGDYQRKPYFVIINSAIEPTNNKNRVFCTYDIYPTILASLGVKFDSDRLALGTNLFSNKPTLLEELGNQFFEEVSKSSDFYINKILLNK